MSVPAPDERLRRLHELAEERRAVIERLKAQLALWKNDRRMKVMGEILLGDIARFEREEAERTARGERGGPAGAD